MKISVIFLQDTNFESKEKNEQEISFTLERQSAATFHRHADGFENRFENVLPSSKHQLIIEYKDSQETLNNQGKHYTTTVLSPEERSLVNKEAHTTFLKKMDKEDASLNSTKIYDEKVNSLLNNIKDGVKKGVSKIIRQKDDMDM